MMHIILKSEKSLYGLKQASANWYNVLHKALKDRGLKESSADACVFLWKGMIVLVYINNCILISNKQSVLKKVFIDLLNDGPENFIFTDECKLNKYFGVEIKKLDDKKGCSLTQPFLIEWILKAAKIDTRMTNSRTTPVVGPLLLKDTNRLPCKHTWKYCTMIGMIGYLSTNIVIRDINGYTSIHKI